MRFNYTPEITFESTRCYTCGRWWAFESNWPGTCPKCAVARLNEKQSALDAACRTISALRGALTKARRARGAA